MKPTRRTFFLGGGHYLEIVWDNFCCKVKVKCRKQAYMSSLHRLKKCGGGFVFIRVILQRKFSVGLLDGRLVALRFYTERQVRVFRQPPHGRR